MSEHIQWNKTIDRKTRRQVLQFWPARALHSCFSCILACAKLIYEAIEEIDQTQVEAIEATGGSRAQQMIYGIVPQILPTIAGVGVFRWDINVRGSTILGIVGAGGIGVQLNAAINVLAWTQVSMILIVILGTVFLSEYISAKVRGAII